MSVMGVMKFKIAKFPVQFGGNYNRLWRQAVLFPLKKCRVWWTCYQSANANPGEWNTVSRGSFAFFKFCFCF